MSSLPEFIVTKNVELKTGFAYVAPLGPVAAFAPEGVIMVSRKFVELSKEVLRRGLITIEELTVEAISHEMLHKILFEIEDRETCEALDAIAYSKQSQWNGGM